MTDPRSPWAFVALAVLAVGACGPDRLAEAAGETLGVDEAARLIADHSRLAPDTQVVRVVAELWVDYTLLADAVASDSALARIDLEPATRQPLEEIMLGRLQEASIRVDSTLTDEELRSRFAAEMPGARATASHILLALPPNATAVQRDSVRRLAESLRERAAAGEDFPTLVMTHSSDPGSARFAGRLGTFERGVMLPPIDEAVFSMAPGEVSPPVETELGIHVIKMEALDAPDFDSAGEAYRAQLIEDRRIRAEEAFVAELEDSAGLALTEPAVEAARAIARNPVAYLTARARTRALATFEGGAYRAGAFQDLMQNAGPDFLSRVLGATDEGLAELLMNLARQQMLVHEARSRGFTPSEAEADSVSQRIRDRIRSLGDRIGVTVSPGPEADTGTAEGGVSPALDAVSRVISGTQEIVPLGGVTFLLRRNGDWRVHDEAVRATVARSRELEGA